MRRKLLALGGVAVLALAACSTGTHQAAPATTTPAPPTSAPLDPSVIPPVITVPYVNAVFAVLNHINGDAARSLIASRRLTPTVIADLRAIYGDPLYAVEIRVADEALTTDFANVRMPPGDRRTLVTRVISASARCVFVETRSDLSAVEIVPTRSAASEYWDLRPKQAGSDPRKINPTPWALAFNEAFLTPTTVTDQCSG